MPPASCKLVIPPSLCSAENSLSALRVIAVIMIVMYREHGIGHINDLAIGSERLPDQPVVPKDPPYNESRDVPSVKAARKNKIVNPFGPAPQPVPQNPPAQLRLPVLVSKIQGHGDFDVPPASHHQEVPMPLAHALHRIKKIPHQQNVAIDVAEQIVPRDGLRPAKHVVQSLCSKLVAIEVRFVAQPRLFCRFGRALLIAKQNHFHFGVQQSPAFQRILLNDSVMSDKRFRCGEEREHCVPASPLFLVYSVESLLVHLLPLRRDDFLENRVQPARN